MPPPLWSRSSLAYPFGGFFSHCRFLGTPEHLCLFQVTQDWYLVASHLLSPPFLSPLSLLQIPKIFRVTTHVYDSRGPFLIAIFFNHLGSFCETHIFPYDGMHSHLSAIRALDWRGLPGGLCCSVRPTVWGPGCCLFVMSVCCEMLLWAASHLRHPPLAIAAGAVIAEEFHGS